MRVPINPPKKTLPPPDTPTTNDPCAEELDHQIATKCSFCGGFGRQMI